MKWYLKVVRDNYSNFNGRARREEFWMFTLINTLIVLVLSILSAVLTGMFDNALLFVPIVLYVLGTLVPTLAVNVRRLHDIDKSGWYFLMSFIPYVGSIIMLVYNVKEGTRGTNQYGVDPKNPNQDDINNIGKPTIEA